MGAYVEKVLTNFRESLTEAIKDSTKKGGGLSTSLLMIQELYRFLSSMVRILLSPEEGRLNCREKNAKGERSELEKLMNAGAAPSRIERQLKKLNNYETDCVLSREEVLVSVEEEKFMDELLKEWDEFHSQILLISGMAKDFIANNGVNASSTEITEHITSVKLPLLQLPKFSGNVLCLSLSWLHSTRVIMIIAS